MKIQIQMLSGVNYARFFLMPENKMKYIHVILVGIQFVGIALCTYDMPPFSDVPLATYMLAACGSLCFLVILAYNRIGNFNISPALKRDAELITRGPYAVVRHPMYSALLILMLGAVLADPSVGRHIGFMILIFALVLKSTCEERYLRQRFSEYAAYAAQTKRMIPYMW